MICLGRPSYDLDGPRHRWRPAYLLPLQGACRDAITILDVPIHLGYPIYLAFGCFSQTVTQRNDFRVSDRLGKHCETAVVGEPNFGNTGRLPYFRVLLHWWGAGLVPSRGHWWNWSRNAADIVASLNVWTRWQSLRRPLPEILLPVKSIWPCAARWSSRVLGLQLKFGDACAQKDKQEILLDSMVLRGLCSVSQKSENIGADARLAGGQKVSGYLLGPSLSVCQNYSGLLLCGSTDDKAFL